VHRVGSFCTDEKRPEAVKMIEPSHRNVSVGFLPRGCKWSCREHFWQ